MDEEKKILVISRSPYRLEFHVKDSDGRDIGKVVMPRAGQKPAELEPEHLEQLKAQAVFADMIADKTYQVIDYMPKKFATTDAQVAIANARAEDAKKAEKHAKDLLAETQAERDALAEQLKGFDGTLEVGKKLKEAEAERDALAERVAELEKLKGKPKDVGTSVPPASPAAANATPTPGANS